MSKNPRELYGESIFTSFRTVNGVIYGLDHHLERLMDSVNEYYFLGSRSGELLNSYFKLKIKVLNFAKTKQNHYFRINIYNPIRENLIQQNFGLSDLEEKITIEDFDFTPTSLSLNIMPTPFSADFKQIKSSSYFQNFYFKRKSISLGFDDVLFERNGDVLEASTSNIVFIKNDTLTFPASSTIFPGVTKKLLESNAKKMGIEIFYKVIKLSDLPSFEGAALINSVQFIRPISRINDINYETEDLFTLRDKFFKALQV